MEYVTRGASELRVSRLAFGCEPLGGTDWGAIDPSEVRRAARRALDAGVTMFDTADVYGLGLSEQRLAEALGERRKTVVIATKFGVGWAPAADGSRARTFRDASAARVVSCLEASLRRLRLDQIPLYQLHWPDPQTPVAATMETLARCVEAGKVKCIGACNVSAAAIAEMHAIVPLTSIQLPFNLLDSSSSSEALAFCKARGIATLAYGCLAQGLLTGKYRATDRFGENDRRSRLPHFQPTSFREHEGTLEWLHLTARAIGKTPAQVALRWVLDNGVDVAIVGAKRDQQVTEHLGAFGWTLPLDGGRRQQMSARLGEARA